jgi:beta-glucosidase
VESTLKELKAFEKVYLQPGETKTVEIALDKYAFSHWDEALEAWFVKPGQYGITVGSSAEDKGLNSMLEIKTEMSWRGL